MYGGTKDSPEETYIRGVDPGETPLPTNSRRGFWSVYRSQGVSALWLPIEELEVSGPIPLRDIERNTHEGNSLFLYSRHDDSRF